MNGCFGNTTHCTGRDLRQCKRLLRRESRAVCAECRATWTRMGLAFEVIEDPRPTWMQRDLARDFSGTVA